jgi:hydroxyethylthiazole kinase-like uncharacterized protein yjeF
MQEFDFKQLEKLYIPPEDSHKGQNGKLLLIGGSSLFHSASLWALNIASRIVDMVFYASVPQNNEIVRQAKQEFRNGIVIPREKLEDYINEADCVLIGPGMLRAEREEVSSIKSQVSSIKEIVELENEGAQTYWLTKYLLEKYPQKKWVIDAGALQMMEPEWLLPLNGNVVVTPHPGEFGKVFEEEIKNQRSNLKDTDPSYAEATAGKQNSKIDLQIIIDMARKYNCIILLKGQEDIICLPAGSDSIGAGGCTKVTGGNAGMTKGGTGDVLAGLVAALACKNDLWLSACAGSYLNKKAGEQLFKRVGYYFNASDLANEIPEVMKKYI